MNFILTCLEYFHHSYIINRLFSSDLLISQEQIQTDINPYGKQKISVKIKKTNDDCVSIRGREKQFVGGNTCESGEVCRPSDSSTVLQHRQTNGVETQK